MKKIISKEVVYDKETPIDLVKNALDCLSTINGAIRTIIYKITYKKRRLFSKKETIEINYKIEQAYYVIGEDGSLIKKFREI